MIEVKTSELTGAALDWAVAQIEAEQNEEWCVIARGMTCTVFVVIEPDTGFNYAPSTDWDQGGPLIQRYGVLISPPTSMVHRNYGNFDKRNGWYESGVWGSTIFGKERKYRRRSFEHPDRPLVAAMRAIVHFELGDVVQVPAELLR